MERADKSVQSQKYGHERFDSLAWEPVNNPRPNTDKAIQQSARSDHPQALEWSLLSTVALLLRANVPRGVQIKGSIDYPNSFTGKDVVSTLQDLLVSEAVGSRHALVVSGDATSIRLVALSLAKSLKSQLFFHEVDWGEKELTDDVDEVYTFLEDSLAEMGGGPEDPDDWAAGLNHSATFDSNLQLSFGGSGNGSGDNARQRRRPPTQRIRTICPTASSRLSRSATAHSAVPVDLRLATVHRVPTRVQALCA